MTDKHKDLLEKMMYCKDVIDGFEESIESGGGNAIEFAYRFGQWKSTLEKSIWELQDEIRKVQTEK